MYKFEQIKPEPNETFKPRCQTSETAKLEFTESGLDTSHVRLPSAFDR